MFSAFLSSSLVGRAIEKGLLKVDLVQIRDFAEGKHSSVDDTPYGGGAGMLLRADVLYRAWESAKFKIPNAHVRTVLLSPQGPLLTQGLVKGWMLVEGEVQKTEPEHLILVCGHYEGVDERFIVACVDEELSIGDYVLTGGELPAMVLIDVLSRLIPGVVGNPSSVTGDSLEDGVLKYPQYTRPRVALGQEVPEILLSGDHSKIRLWRQDQSVQRTAKKRPDLLKKRG